MGLGPIIQRVGAKRRMAEAALRRPRRVPGSPYDVCPARAMALDQAHVACLLRLPTESCVDEERMRARALSAVAAAVVASGALALSGCIEATGDVFGPLASAGGGQTDPTPAVMVKAQPARGPAPLRVTFDLRAIDADDDVEWRVRFGDGSPAAKGEGEHVTQQHVYRKAGTYVATIVFGEGDAAFNSTVAVSVLPPRPVQSKPTPTAAPAADPQPSRGYGGGATGGGAAPSPTAAPASSSTTSTEQGKKEKDAST